VVSEVLCCGARRIDLGHARVMGVLNITPDSFSDGGRWYRDGKPALERVLRRAAQMATHGAAIVDIGGESTRPGAAPVGEQEEIDRVLPVVEAVGTRIDVAISVDTSSPRLMREAAAAGAHLVNDVRALARPGALEAAAASGMAVCLMHMQGEPPTMQRAPAYVDVVSEVCEFLLSRVVACAAAGIARERLVIDPGFGFGKTQAHNLALFRALPRLVALGLPVLVGVSRKSMIARVLGSSARARLAGGLALATLAAGAGAKLLRTHDVRATHDVLAMTAAVAAAGREP
jgi:dihydropteroate synthase